MRDLPNVVNDITNSNNTLFLKIAGSVLKKKRLPKVSLFVYWKTIYLETAIEIQGSLCLNLDNE